MKFKKGALPITGVSDTRIPKHPNTPLPPYPPLRLSWLVWGLAALFYLIGFFHRLAPAVMTQELMRDFDISAAALGNLSGFYFYSYWVMQIPAGILADGWGPRRLLTVGMLGSAIGSLLFAASSGMTAACLGRLLIGACVSVAFVVSLKLAAGWFPPRYYSMISGLVLFTGILGAVSAGVPLRLLVDAFGWRAVMVAAAALTAGIAAVTWRGGPRRPGRARLPQLRGRTARDRGGGPPFRPGRGPGGLPLPQHRSALPRARRRGRHHAHVLRPVGSPLPHHALRSDRRPRPPR